MNPEYIAEDMERRANLLALKPKPESRFRTTESIDPLTDRRVITREPIDQISDREGKGGLE
jgi:hypothetical protein